MSSSQSYASSCMPMALRSVGEALQLDQIEKTKEAYCQYLSCAVFILQSLKEDGWSFDISLLGTQDTGKMFRIVEKCLTRAKDIVMATPVGPGTLSVSTSEKNLPPYQRPFSTSTNNSPFLLINQSPSDVHPPQDSETINKLMLALPTPPGTSSTKSPSTGKRRTSSIGRKPQIQTQQMFNAYQRRKMLHQSQSRQRATNASLESMRRMAETNALKKSREEALYIKIKKRQERAKETAEKRFADKFGGSITNKGYKQHIFAKMLEFEQETTWPQSLRCRLQSNTEDVDLISYLVVRVLRSKEHPLGVLTAELQYLIYRQVAPLVKDFRYPSHLSSPSQRQDKSETNDNNPVSNQEVPPQKEIADKSTTNHDNSVSPTTTQEDNTEDGYCPSKTKTNSHSSLSQYFQAAYEELEDDIWSDDNLDDDKNSCEHDDNVINADQTDKDDVVRSEESSNHRSNQYDLNSKHISDIGKPMNESHDIIDNRSLDNNEMVDIKENMLKENEDNTNTSSDIEDTDNVETIQDDNPTANADCIGMLNTGEEKMSDDIGIEVNDEEDVFESDDARKENENEIEPYEDNLSSTEKQLNDKMKNQSVDEGEENSDRCLNDNETILCSDIIGANSSKTIESSGTSDKETEKNDDICSKKDSDQRTHSLSTNDRKDSVTDLGKQRSVVPAVPPEWSLITTSELDNITSSQTTQEQHPPQPISLNRFNSINIDTPSGLSDALNSIVKDVHEALDLLHSLLIITFTDLECATGRDQSYATLERIFFEPVWPWLNLLFRKVNTAKEELFYGVIQQRRDDKLIDFSVRENFWLNESEFQNENADKLEFNTTASQSSSVSYTAAINELKKVVTLSAPLDKLECAVRTSRIICSTIDEFWQKKRGTPAPSIGCDDLLPILTYVIVQSDMPQLVSECHAMEEFIHEGYLMGEEGYCLTTISTALAYLLS